MQCENHTSIEATCKRDAHFLVAGKVMRQLSGQHGAEFLIVAVRFKRLLLFPLERIEIDILLCKFRVPEYPCRAAWQHLDAFKDCAIFQNTTERGKLT